MVLRQSDRVTNQSLRVLRRPTTPDPRASPTAVQRQAQSRYNTDFDIIDGTIQSMPEALPPPSNFSFLASHDAQLVRLGALAESYFKVDPATCLIKLRQFGEVLAQLTAAKAGLFQSTQELQADLLRRLKLDRVIPLQALDLFHHLRTVGNKATHDNQGTHAEALTALKIARELGVWFHRTFSPSAKDGKSFTPGAFVPPPDPAAATQALAKELARLRDELSSHRTAAEKTFVDAQEQERARLSAEDRAQREQEEKAIWEQLAAEAEQANVELTSQLKQLQADAVVAAAGAGTVAQTPAASPASASIVAKAEEAAANISIDEAATRAIIDEQLRACGWEADTQTLRYALGTRPARGRNVAIAEWPTSSGPADYALFIGLRCIGVIEAKRQNKKVSAHIDQAQRYARTFRFEGGAEPLGGAPWPETKSQSFLVPFVFSTNGRPYLKQIETESGIWFRDVRRPTNQRRALNGWHTPDDFEDGVGRRLRKWMMELCDVHTILRLPTGIFYAQGVKTNVVFLTRGKGDKGNTKGVWVYDMRANMDSFGKSRVLTVADFGAFEKAFGEEPRGAAKRKDEGEEGRFRFFRREEVAGRNDNLDISWLRDTSNDPEDEMTEPEELAAAITSHLKNALEEIEAFSDELLTSGGRGA